MEPIATEHQSADTPAFYLDSVASIAGGNFAPAPSGGNDRHDEDGEQPSQEEGTQE
jgi:hypothetical protein